MFGFGKKNIAPAEVSVPAPTAKHYEMTEAQQKVLDSLKTDENGFVALGDVARGLLNQQAQYASEYMDGRSASPVLVDGLRVDVDHSSYHEYRIHSEDAHEFVARVRAWRNRY